MSFRYRWHNDVIRPFQSRLIGIIEQIKSLFVIDRFIVLLPVIILLCGIMVVVGVFLQWFHVSMSVLVFPLSYSASGWAMAAHDSLMMNIFNYFSDNTFPQPYFVLSGGALIIISTLCAFALFLLKKEKLNIMVKVQGIIAVIAALYTFSITIWFLASGSDMQKHFNNSYVSVDSAGLSYGFYVSTAFSFLALIAGIVMSVRVFRQTKHYNNKEGLLK